MWFLDQTPYLSTLNLSVEADRFRKRCLLPNERLHLAASERPDRSVYETITLKTRIKLCYRHSI